MVLFLNNSKTNVIFSVDPRVMSGEYMRVVSHALLKMLQVLIIFIFTLISVHLPTTHIKQILNVLLPLGVRNK